MDDDELLYREMDEDDPFYMGDSDDDDDDRDDNARDDNARDDDYHDDRNNKSHNDKGGCAGVFLFVTAILIIMYIW